MNNKYVLIALSLCSVSFAHGAKFKLQDTSKVRECSISYKDNSNKNQRKVINKEDSLIITIDLKNIGDGALNFRCSTSYGEYQPEGQIRSGKLDNDATYEIIEKIDDGALTKIGLEQKVG